MVGISRRYDEGPVRGVVVSYNESKGISVFGEGDDECG